MRLNKWLVLAGVASSRRKADELVIAGEVTVRDRMALVGEDIGEDDQVYFQRRLLQIPDNAPRLTKFYKPRGVVSSHQRQKNAKLVFDYLPELFGHDIMIGRLDRESEGLMLLTNDGQLAHRLMHPSFNIDRIYEVETVKPITENQIKQLLTGVSLDDGMSRAKSVKRLSEHQLEITLTEGRNHQIRRTLAHLGHRVSKLVRIQHGPYRLAGLESGSWQEIPIEKLP